MKTKQYKIEFVDNIPKNLKDGVLYVCIECKVIVHKCACGCGEKTVTPIDRKHGWIMQYDGQTISLRPSIGNFSMPCKSHYYITENKVQWLENCQTGKTKNNLFTFIKKLFNK